MRAPRVVKFGKFRAVYLKTQADSPSEWRCEERTLEMSAGRRRRAQAAGAIVAGARGEQAPPGQMGSALMRRPPRAAPRDPRPRGPATTTCLPRGGRRAGGRVCRPSSTATTRTPLDNHAVRGDMMDLWGYRTTRRACSPPACCPHCYLPYLRCLCAATRSSSLIVY